MALARNKRKTGTDGQLRREVRRSFNEAVGSIAMEERNLTVWEADCLRAALFMMAAGDFGTAAMAIENCRHGPIVGSESEWTVEDMRAGLAMLRAARRKPPVN